MQIPFTPDEPIEFISCTPYIFRNLSSDANHLPLGWKILRLARSLGMTIAASLSASVTISSYSGCWADKSTGKSLEE